MVSHVAGALRGNEAQNGERGTAVFVLRERDRLVAVGAAALGDGNDQEIVRSEKGVVQRFVVGDRFLVVGREVLLDEFLASSTEVK